MAVSFAMKSVQNPKVSSLYFLITRYFDYCRRSHSLMFFDFNIAVLFIKLHDKIYVVF